MNKVIAGLFLLMSTTCATAYAGDWSTVGQVTASTQNIINNDNKNYQSLADEINTDTQNIIAALKAMSTQETENTTAQTNQIASMNDVRDQREVSMRVQEAKYNAINNATSGASLCNALTGAAASQNLAQLVQMWRMNAVSAMHAHDVGHLTNQPAPVTETALMEVYNKQHCANNATSADIQLGRCGSSGSVTQTQSANSTGSDQFVSTPDDQNADLFLNQTVMTPKQQTAMGRLLALLSNPYPTGQIAIPNSIPSAERDRMFYDVDVKNARNSIAQSILSGLIADTQIIGTSGGQTQDKAKDWANNTAKNVLGYTPGADGTYFPNGVSDLAYDELQSKYWYYNLTYGVQASSQSAAPSQKDMNMMMAWEEVMRFKEYKQLREINASLAELLTIMNEHYSHNNGTSGN